MLGRPPRDQASRFREKVQRGEPDACWAWQAGLDHDGYGRFKYRYPSGFYRGLHAHRVAWILTNGDPGVLLVRHVACGNKACCNPSHLAIGTDADNADDRERDGRTARGERSGSRLHPERLKRGQHHANAVLSADGAREVLALSQTLTQRDLAKRFGVSKGTISNVLKGRHWAHGG